MKAAFDLHFHSCLSPCGDGAMTPATIAGMCKLAGIDVAALTDHNTCGNCAAFCQACQAYGLLGLPGMELCTAEEVHVVCLLPDLAAADAFSRMVYDRLPPLENDRDIFGPQIYMDADDQRAGGREPGCWPEPPPSASTRSGRWRPLRRRGLSGPHRPPFVCFAFQPGLLGPRAGLPTGRAFPSLPAGFCGGPARSGRGADHHRLRRPLPGSDCRCQPIPVPARTNFAGSPGLAALRR